MTIWEEEATGYVVRIVFGEDTPMFVSTFTRGGTHHCVQFCPDIYNAHMYSSERTAKKCLFDTCEYLTHMDPHIKSIHASIVRCKYIRHYDKTAADGYKGSIRVKEAMYL